MDLDHLVSLLINAEDTIIIRGRFQGFMLRDLTELRPHTIEEYNCNRGGKSDSARIVAADASIAVAMRELE